MRQRRWVEYHTQTAAAAQSKSPRRIQAAGAIAGLYEFAPQEEVVEPEVAENGQAPEVELAEA